MMDRKEFFALLRPAFPNKSIPANAVKVIDDVADRLGMPRLGSVPPPPPKPVPAPVSAKKLGALAGVVGVGAAAILTPFVAGWEDGPKGPALVPYRDIVGVWTQCSGETLNVTAASSKETPEGCAIKLDTRLAGFAQEVVKCTPGLRGRDAQWAAATSLAYNIGVKAYCGSTVDRRFDAGQWRAACDAMLAWKYAGGRVVKGLENRRAAERELCLKGV